MKANALLLALDGLSAEAAAARLIGSDIIRVIAGQKLIGRIVETEAYDESDAASHSFKGITPRTAVMFGPAGYAYVYFTYGRHFCLNVVVGQPGAGAAVLIRALEPIAGLKQMALNRGLERASALLSGPAKITQALKIDRSFNGHNLTKPPLELKLQPPVPEGLIGWSKRIGISHQVSAELPLRAVLRASPFLSRSE